MQAWERFLEKYRAFGEHPSRDNHARLFDPAATVQHPGMSAPMPAGQYVNFIAEGLKRLPDFRLIPIHWAVSGNTIFVEARNTATVGGRPICWPATYVVTLREEMVIRGRAYYDRMEVLAHFEPELAGQSTNAHAIVLEGAVSHGASPSDDEEYARLVYERIVMPYAANGNNPDPYKFQQFYTPDARMINPGFVRPLRRGELPGYYAALKSQIHDLRMRMERWAAAPQMLFIEWTVTGEIGGRRFELANTDRFTLRGMLAAEGVAYFDNMQLRAMTEPGLARFDSVSFADLPAGTPART
jgi:SnoaL-like protein